MRIDFRLLRGHPNSQMTMSLLSGSGQERLQALARLARPLVSPYPDGTLYSTDKLKLTAALSIQ